MFTLVNAIAIIKAGIL